MIMHRSVHNKTAHQNGVDQKPSVCPSFSQSQPSAYASFAFSVVIVWTCSYSAHLVTYSNLQSEQDMRQKWKQ